MYSGAPDKGQTAAADSSYFKETLVGGFPPACYLHWAATILLVYFGLRLLFLATYIAPFIPPDETTHFGICEIFSRVVFLPDNSPDSYQYGLVTNIPWLYYWIMGKLLSLNFTGIADLVFLRLFNIPLAFALVFYVWRTLRLVTDDRLSQILLLAAMTNTMMLTFLSAFVSYDNLTNLLAAMAIYYLLDFFKNRSANILMLAILCQLGGCLTKVTLLPLVLILNSLLVVCEFNNLRRLPAALSSCYRNPKRSGIVLTLAILVGLALNIQLYGGNYLHFRSIAPEMTQVLPLENALKYRLIARNYIFELFRDDKISKEKALEMTAQIEHSGDRADAVFMIENYAKFRNGEIHRMGLAEYIPVWTERMAAGIFGVFAHRQIANYWPTIAPIALLAALTLLAFLIRWRPGDAERIPSYLLMTACLYTSFLIYVVNYHEYLSNGAPFIALQGRYLFPVIGPIYVLASVYLIRLFNGRLARTSLCGTAVFIFIMCDFPLFLSRRTPDWSYWPPN